jgi:hypothetical protein
MSLAMLVACSDPPVVDGVAALPLPRTPAGINRALLSVESSIVLDGDASVLEDELAVLERLEREWLAGGARGAIGAYSDHHDLGRLQEEATGDAYALLRLQLAEPRVVETQARPMDVAPVALQVLAYHGLQVRSAAIEAQRAHRRLTRPVTDLGLLAQPLDILFPAQDVATLIEGAVTTHALRLRQLPLLLRLLGGHSADDPLEDPAVRGWLLLPHNPS